jgi:hypothetical protein
MQLLFIITSDPRRSPRPAEAIRIAAGVGVWKRTGLTVYLRGAAVLALSETAEELVDEENYRRYLPSVQEFGGPVYVQRGAPLLAQLGESPTQFEEIDDAQLARLASTSTSILRF